MTRYLVNAVVVALLLSAALFAQDSSNEDKNFDVRSTVGDLHIGADADARKAGLPLYPGARLSVKDKKEDKDKDNDADSDRVNLGVLTEAFGIKLIVAKYDSDDAPGKVVDFYRDKLKKYGKVLECHSQKHGVHVNSDDDSRDSKDSDSKASKELKCDGDNTGPVTELKVGTEDDQHDVAIEPHDSGKGTTFSLVYVHTRGKRGEI
ncbi:MAG: hypothetical protein WB729_01105 [Candidatus Sulfotelmatobacter sp.]